MFNFFAKFLLTSTSIAPVLVAIAINQYAYNSYWVFWIPWLLVAVLLVVLCWILLVFAEKNMQTVDIQISEFERNDKEVLAFLVAYLLPFLTMKESAIHGKWLMGTYILFIIFISISHAGIFHFNPIMGLFGYHFYKVKLNDGISQVVISKKELMRTGINLTSVKLATHLYLQVKDENV